MLLLEDLHLFAQTAQLFFLHCGEPIALSSVDLCLVDPLLAQCLGGDLQSAGYLRYGILLVRGVNQPNGFLLELRRVELASLTQLLRPLSRNLIA
jgi:hypothetical protein